MNPADRPDLPLQRVADRRLRRHRAKLAHPEPDRDVGEVQVADDPACTTSSGHWAPPIKPVRSVERS